MSEPTELYGSWQGADDCIIRPEVRAERGFPTSCLAERLLVMRTFEHRRDLPLPSVFLPDAQHR